MSEKEFLEERKLHNLREMGLKQTIESRNIGAYYIASIIIIFPATSLFNLIVFVDSSDGTLSKIYALLFNPVIIALSIVSLWSLYNLVFFISIVLFFKRKNKGAGYIKQLIEIEFRLITAERKKEKERLVQMWISTMNLCIKSGENNEMFADSTENAHFIKTMRQRKAEFIQLMKKEELLEQTSEQA